MLHKSYSEDAPLQPDTIFGHHGLQGPPPRLQGLSAARAGVQGPNSSCAFKEMTTERASQALDKLFQTVLLSKRGGQYFLKTLGAIVEATKLRNSALMQLSVW